MTRRRSEGRRGRPRRRQARGRSLVGESFDVEVGTIAHGGHCVARLPGELPEVGGTVVFVRHALPGEQVRVTVTEGQVGDRFLRADAVAVHRGSPDRVSAPCRFAGPGGCGGCDFQHVQPAAQRELKGAVVAEQLRRLAGVEWQVRVEPVPSEPPGLRWRTRMRYHRADDGTLGLLAHRSLRVVPVDDCLIQAPGAQVTVQGEPVGEPPATRVVRGRTFEVAPDGFWQAHVAAPEVLVEAVLAGADLGPGDVALDLFSGVGLFTVFLAEAVGPGGLVRAVEGDPRAAGIAESNVAAYPWVQVVHGPVGRILEQPLERPADVVVLDPPRTGARREVVDAVARLRPSRVVHVACDPAAFARDVSLFAEHGYTLTSVRAFDLFPMTHHVEVVGTLAQVS